MGEVLAQLVGNMHRQSRLAHTGWSIDGDHRPARHSVGAEHAATEFLGLARTTNEIGHIVGQLSRYSRDSQLCLGSLVVEELCTRPPKSLGEQVAIEVVRLLVVVDPAADEPDQALGLGELSTGGMPALVGRPPGG